MIPTVKTTLIIPDALMRELKRRAADRGTTLSAVVAEILRRGLRDPVGPAEPPPLPRHSMGRTKVDLADRDALFRTMEGA